MLIAALVPASAELVWILYNTYVPLWLQAGNSVFSGETSLQGFGLSAVTTGTILTIGNLIALVVSPIVGILSDSTHSRFGRRMPWYTFPAPFIILTLCLIPYLSQHATLKLFMINIGIFLVALAIIRGPSTVLLYDITPSKYRGIAAALSGIAGGTAGIVGAILAAALFGIRPELPFWIVSALIGSAILSAAVFIREPVPQTGEDTTSRLSPGKMLSMLISIPRDHLASTILLVLNTLFTYITFGQMQIFTSSYGVSVLGLKPANSSLIYAFGGAAFILFSFPASAIATKWLSRKSTQLLGILMFIPISLIIYFFANTTNIWVMMVILGITWAMIIITQEPMMLDSAPSDALLGTFSAILQVARTLGFVISPILGGWFIQASGSNFNTIWLVMASAQLIALLTLLPVTHGEAREVN